MRDDTVQRAPKKMKGDVGVSGMHLHFANMEDKSITDVNLEGESSRIEESDKKSGNLSFPFIDKDVLLYLAVLGGKNFSAYYNYTNGEAYSTVAVFQEWGSATGGEIQHTIFQRPKLQLLVEAGRKKGKRGEKEECFISIRDADALLTNYPGLKKKFNRTKIPFLAPPTAIWPDYITAANGSRDGGCMFGHLFRAQRNERLDIYVLSAGYANPLFVCEGKYWNKTLDGGMMKKVISGLDAAYSGIHQQPKWNKWDLAFVFCQELVRSGSLQLNLSIFRILVSSPSIARQKW
ncbi:hypothetical protein DVH05_004481 [Phytophthora capsici]|nr:hypothetical protein DVH05_004481 [Phytophthora capsici]